MSGGAPYGFDITLSDDATPEFVLEWEMDDGTVFPWADYSFTYSVHREGVCCWSCDYGWPGYGGDQDLAQASGITIDASTNLITFTLASTLRPGLYEHGCKAVHTATGKALQLFDGQLTIKEGNFR